MIVMLDVTVEDAIIYKMDINDDDYKCGICKNQLINPANPLHGVYPRPCSSCALAMIAKINESLWQSK
jgi:arginine/ornithine N-succinyltransferase beta subunit